VEALYPRPGYCGVRCDVADPAQVAAAFERGVRAFGGIDMLVLNAGVFPASRMHGAHRGNRDRIGGHPGDR
jgi:NAD(P)-dependent dehydrogenase (short-subunit alcohol dehydrogenase family)